MRGWSSCGDLGPGDSGRRQWINCKHEVAGRGDEPHRASCWDWGHCLENSCSRAKGRDHQVRPGARILRTSVAHVLVLRKIIVSFPGFKMAILQSPHASVEGIVH